MKGKIIRTGEECRKSIQKAVNVAADVGGSTLGPRGRNVCINKLNQAHITKDGVSVVKEIYLNDEVENLALSVLKQSSLQTLNDAGDGTTTCLLLAQSIYNQGMKYIASQYNPILLKRGMDYAVEKCVEHLKNKSIKIEDIKQIEQVATISANGDQNIGALISKAVDKVGKDGKIVIDENSKPQIDVEYEEGMVLDRGYISPLFVNKGNEGRATCEFDDAFILLHDGELSNPQELAVLLQEVASSGKQLLIISESYSDIVLRTLIENKMRGVLNVCAIKAAGFGQRRKEILMDLGSITGGTVISNDLGTSIQKTDLKDLGTAKKIIITRADTTILDGGGSEEEVLARITQVKDDINTVFSMSDYDRQRAEERLARLTGGIAIIKVGGSSDVEQKEIRDRVEDSMLATQCAIEEGIIFGGGSALISCSKMLEKLSPENMSIDEVEGIKIIRDAIKEPLRRIAQNAGMTSADMVVAEVFSKEDGFGYNAYNGEYCDMVESGIIDPVKVIRCALQNASSVAGMLLTTEAIVTDPVEDV